VYKTAPEEREVRLRNPTRGTFVGCCASAITPTASCTATTRTDKRAALFIAHFARERTYHAGGNSENDYLQQKGNQIRRGEKTNFNVGLKTCQFDAE